jgi:hypothetical protein
MTKEIGWFWGREKTLLGWINMLYWCCMLNGRPITNCVFCGAKSTGISLPPTVSRRSSLEEINNSTNIL